MNIEESKNTLREFQAEISQIFKNTQGGFKKTVSYIKKIHPSPLSVHCNVNSHTQTETMTGNHLADC